MRNIKCNWSIIIFTAKTSHNAFITYPGGFEFSGTRNMYSIRYGSKGAVDSSGLKTIALLNLTFCYFHMRIYFH